MKKQSVVHARRQGSKRPLCGKAQGKTTQVATAVTCVACGREAERVLRTIVDQAEAEREASLGGRQAAALAAAQPPRWWESQQKKVTDG